MGVDAPLALPDIDTEHAGARIAAKIAAQFSPPMAVEATHVWLVDPDAGKIAHESLDIGRQALEERVGRLARSIRSGEAAGAFVEAQIKGLSKLLLPAEASHIPTGKQLVIVPDGPLYGVPFAMLELDGEPLATRNTLSYAPSLAVLHILAQKHRRVEWQTAKVLAFGRPKLPPGRWADLPFAEAEVKAIGQAGGARATVLVGAQASEAKVKAEAKGHDILHFATHASLMRGRPGLSCLVLSREEETHKEDGLLRASEVVDLDLQAKLVVLSACQSGLGGYVEGEGLVGLSRAFFAAGADAVLATQWQINDASTAEFMKQFYAALFAGKAPAKALQEVQWSWRKRAGLEEAGKWAPFMLVGYAG